jgi:hypothetical protein
MSVQIDTAFVEQYSANVQLLSQQKGSRLRSLVREEGVRGKNAFFEQIGAVAARQRPSRHADTPRMDTPHARRRVSLADYDWADLIDDEDKVRMLIDPTSTYSMAAAMAMGRSMDDVVIAAATGTSYTGTDGSTAVALPAGQKIVVNASGLTLPKLLAAKELLDAADVDEDIPRHILVTAGQVTDLLNTTEIKDSDFNTVKALAAGQVDSFLGFKFTRIQRLGTDSNGDRQVIAFAEDGLLLGVGMNPAAKIAERPDKNHATQVFYNMAIGATRMEEVKVVEIACAE